MPHAKQASEQRPLSETKTTATPVEAKPKQTPTAKKKAVERSKKAVNGFITSQPANH
jgi:hypothetical protein